MHYLNSKSMKQKDVTRRDFIKTTTAATAGAILAPVVACSTSPYDSKGLPTTMLGKTGVRTSQYTIGALFRAVKKVNSSQ